MHTHQSVVLVGCPEEENLTVPSPDKENTVADQGRGLSTKEGQDVSAAASVPECQCALSYLELVILGCWGGHVTMGARWPPYHRQGLHPTYRHPVTLPRGQGEGKKP